MVAALPLDEAISNIKQLKSRVEDVSQRNMRYNLIGESSFRSTISQQQLAVDADATAVFDILVETRDTARKQRGLGDLTDLITKDDNDLQVISVWGTRGNFGITSVIRKVYDDPEICQNFRYRGWVKLMYPVDPHQVIESLSTQFIINSCQPQRGSMNVDDLLTKLKTTSEIQDGHIKNFMSSVNNNRYFIVLEDLFTMVEWDAIRTYLPDAKNGSRIVVSTQQFEVASLCTGLPHQVSELEQLSDDHSVCVFFREGPHSREDEDEDTYTSITSNEIYQSEEYNGEDHPPNFCQGAGYEDEETAWMKASERMPTEDEARRVFSSCKENFTSKMSEARNWEKKFQPVGRKMDRRDLAFLLCQAANGRKEVISVWGIAGVGKSFLVRMVYYGEIRHYRNFKKYGWINVTYPFNLREFFRTLLSDMDPEYLQAKGTSYFGTMGIKDPIRECCKLLHEDKCLVVIDGLQSTEEWNLIKSALSNGSKSCVVVITNEASVATYCAVPANAVFNVKGLEAEEALELLQKEVYGVGETETLQKDVDMMNQAKLILNKCGGLPEVIVAIGGFLATKINMTMWSDLNHRFMHNLETNPVLGTLRGVLDWMHSYFLTCPDSVKPCIFYLSIFPRDYCIRRRRLVRRWIAEGYCRDTNVSAAEDNGEEFFSMLFDLSIIQDPSQTATEIYRSKGMKISFCQVNGFIREYIVSRPMEDNFICALEGRCRLNSQYTGRHMVIGSSWDRDINVFESIDLSRLRSLTVLGNWKPFFISKRMKLLRVLDLEGTLDVTDEDIKFIGKLLPRLKFLSLRRCRAIHHLPSSLSGLRHLQTLDIRHTSIASLPPTIVKLQKLQYIRAGTTIPLVDDDDGIFISLPADESSAPPRNIPHNMISWLSKFHGHQLLGGVKVPTRIGKLTNLHTLGVISVSVASWKAILKEIKNLTQLRKFGVSGINRKNSYEFFASISGHGHLESLSVWLEKDSHGCMDGISQPPENLLSLKLYGLGDKLPLWISQLHNLTKLKLEMTMLGREDICILGDLRNLVILHLFVKPIQDGQLYFYPKPEEVDCAVFGLLHVLEIACNSTLLVRFGKLAMPDLELLKVCCYRGSSLQFSGLENLYSLKEVSVKGSYDDKLKEALQNQLKKHSKPEGPVSPNIPVLKFETASRVN